MMRVILQQEVSNLGRVGDQVTVKPGFARNYLIPRGKAVRATTENIASFEMRRAEFEKMAHETLAAAKVRAEQIELASVTISAIAGEGGKLFGSVGPRDIAEAATQAGMQLHKSEVLMPEGPIRHLGEFAVSVKLHSAVSSSLKVVIVAST
jgi:large subunit ribosomal protein L9